MFDKFSTLNTGPEFLVLGAVDEDVAGGVDNEKKVAESDYNAEEADVLVGV